MIKEKYLHAGLLVFGVLAPFLFPNYTVQISLLWIMILFALTWDTLGGQMGYNSLGNIVFFGVGMYISAIVQIGVVYDVALYTSPDGAALTGNFAPAQYYTGLALGILAAAVGCVILAVLFSQVFFGLRGPYFAIGTLGLALAAGELVGAWDYVGGGGGIALPVFPSDPKSQGIFFYYLCLVSALATYVFLRWLYNTRFGLAINAIRDDEEKAEAMGIHTKRHKTAAWCTSAFFLGISGALFGNMTGFIEPLEVAFPTITFGIFMVAMALLGGKGTLWGPILGAIVFHLIKEVTWTYLLGWQWIALGTLIIINVVYFQQGILGWARDKWPDLFGLTVDEAMSSGSEKRGSS